MTATITHVRDIRLGGRVALVTGAVGGMGKAMATALARAGASVAVCGRRKEAVAAAVSELAGESPSNRVIGVVADITREADCVRAVAETIAAFGGLHILVNNAALGPRHVANAPRFKGTRFWEVDPDSYRQVIDTNAVGTFLMSHAAAPELIRAGWGRIITVTTGLDTLQCARWSPYNASKAALESSNLTWAKELAGTGVTANTITSGGATDSEFLSPQEKADIRAAGRRLLSPEVMAGPVVWLSSTLADGVTGARFIGKLWNNDLPIAEAAANAREPQVFLPAP